MFAYSIIGLTSALYNFKTHHNSNQQKLFSYMPKHSWLTRLLQMFADENLDNNQK